MKSIQLTPKKREKRIKFIITMRKLNFRFLDIAKMLDISRQRLLVICRKNNITDQKADPEILKKMVKKYYE